MTEDTLAMVRTRLRLMTARAERAEGTLDELRFWLRCIRNRAEQTGDTTTAGLVTGALAKLGPETEAGIPDVLENPSK